MPFNKTRYLRRMSLIIVCALFSACGGNATKTNEDWAVEHPGAAQYKEEEEQASKRKQFTPDPGDFLDGAWYGTREPSEGFIAVMNAVEKIGYINYKGKQVIPCKYNDARSFRNGYAAVNTAGLWGFIDTKGNEVIPPSYKVCSDFFGDYVLAVKDSEYAYLIDSKGKETPIDRFGNKISLSTGNGPHESPSAGHSAFYQPLILMPNDSETHHYEGDYYGGLLQKNGTQFLKGADMIVFDDMAMRLDNNVFLNGAGQSVNIQLPSNLVNARIAEYGFVLEETKSGAGNFSDFFTSNDINPVATDNLIYALYTLDAGNISGAAAYDFSGSLKYIYNDKDITSVGDGYIIYREGGYYGALGVDGKQALDCTWSSLNSIGNDMFAVGDAVIDIKGNIIIPNINYNAYTHFYNGFLKTRAKYGYKFYDKKGHELPDIPVMNAGQTTNFSDSGLAAIFTCAPQNFTMTRFTDIQSFTIVNDKMKIVSCGDFAQTESVNRDMHYSESLILKYLNAGLFPIVKEDGIQILKL